MSNEKTMAMFDTVEGSNQGAKIELLTKNGDPSGVKVFMLGPDSDEAIRADRAINLRNMKLHQKNASNRVDIQADIIEKLVAVTTGWENMPGENGEPRPFSKDAAREIYTKYPAIRRDLLREHEDVRNFIKG